jgi:hypothetical protein
MSLDDKSVFSCFQVLYLATSPLYRYLLHHFPLLLLVSSLLLIVFPVTDTGSIGQRVSVVTSPRPSGILYHVCAFHKGCLFASYKARVNRDVEMVCLLDL